MSKEYTPHWPHRGCLVNATDGPLAGKVFYVSRGLRHWVTDASWIVKAGFIPENVLNVPGRVVQVYAPGRSVPQGDWLEGDLSKDSKKYPSNQMRELCASQLKGSGLEFEPGDTPFPIPLRCEVMYADPRNYDDIIGDAHRGQDVEMIPFPQYQMSFEDMDRLVDQSQDFLVASHVIQRCSNPLKALRRAYDVLKPGGSLVLVVPDKGKTFDYDRDVTELDHIIQDFYDPSSDRDIEHYKEFYQKAYVTGEDCFEETWRRNWEVQHPIHYHTWTYESFVKMVEWAIEKLTPFSSVRSWPTLLGPSDIEFYVLLKK